MTKSLVLTSVLFFSNFSAQAVVTKNCPKTLNISYEKITSYTQGSVINHAKLTGVDQNDALVSWTTLSTLNELQNISLELSSTKGSMCRYLPHERPSNPDGLAETRMYTASGRDILRVSFQIGSEIFWAYHNISSYSQSDISVDNHTGTIFGGNNDHGAVVVEMGKAVNLYISE